MSKIKTCEPVFLLDYKAKFFSEYKDYYINKDKEMLLALFDNEAVYELNSECEDIELSVNDSDASNIKKVYQSLSSLNRRYAVNEELLFTMIHTHYLDYLLDYIEVNKIEDIQDLIFFKGDTLTSLFKQLLSKYYWLGYFFKDDKEGLYLEDYISNDLEEKLKMLIEHNFYHIEGLLFKVVMLLKDNDLSNIEAYRYLNQRLDHLSSVLVIDLLDDKELNAYIESFVEDYKK